MADLPKWQILQEAWNALIPEAERLGVPRVRPVKIGTESIKYREERLAWLRGQIKIQGGDPNPGPTAAGAASTPLRGGVKLRTPQENADYYLRHDLSLMNYDIAVSFTEGPEEILHVQAREPLSAMRLAVLTPTREWSAEKMLSVTGMRITRVSH